VRYVISGGEKLGEDVARLYQIVRAARLLRVTARPNARRSSHCPLRATGPTGGCCLASSIVERIPGIEHGGVLHLRGPNVMLGDYRFSDPGVLEPPRSAYGEGWHCTGDVVDVGEDGVIKVVGRRGRFAKIAGEMVALDEVERIAQYASPGHQHAAVVRAESASGETTVLFTTDRELTRSALLHAARELGWRDSRGARRVEWMPEIPLLGSGKTDMSPCRPSRERVPTIRPRWFSAAVEPIMPYG
jgi:acyl-[acyl-carrier-protein]-phospholipid O-acyltransferase/long-chain-fatty-acid--[acyl-carrier-protein] ligase